MRGFKRFEGRDDLITQAAKPSARLLFFNLCNIAHDFLSAALDDLVHTIACEAGTVKQNTRHFDQLRRLMRGHLNGINQGSSTIHGKNLARHKARTFRG